MKSSATTAKAYLAGVPEERRAAMTRLYRLVSDNLPKGYEEAMAYGMIAWQVPLAVYPDTYNGQPLMYAALASQKNHMALYLMCGRDVVGKGFAKAGKKFDAGKSCIRFRKLEDLVLEPIAEAVRSMPMQAYVEYAKSAHSPEARAARSAKRKAEAKKKPSR